MCEGNCENCKNGHEEVPQPKKRAFLGILVGAINVVLIGGVVGPVLGFVGSPIRNKLKGDWHPVLDDHEIAVGETKEATFAMRIKDGYMMTERKYTVFVRRYEDHFACFDPACTHLGCRIHHNPEKGRYLCPCHGGVFDDEGKVISGPPPKPLDQHPVKLEGGRIWVYKEV